MAAHPNCSVGPLAKFDYGSGGVVTAVSKLKVHPHLNRAGEPLLVGRKQRCLCQHINQALNQEQSYKATKSRGHKNVF